MGKMSALSLTPITAKQAEALHRSEAYVAPGGSGGSAARTPTHSSSRTAYPTTTAHAAHATHSTHSTSTAHPSLPVQSPRHALHALHAQTTQGQGQGQGQTHRADREGYGTGAAPAPTVSGQYEPEIGPRRVIG